MAISSEEKLIVAIELGSSKMVGMAGHRQPDGNLKILAMAEERVPGAIRYGMVSNFEKTNQTIKLIIDKLQAQLDRRIGQAYVALNGRGIYSVKGTISRKNAHEEVITHSLIDSILEDNKRSVPAEKQIIEVVPQEYRVDTQYILDPIGMLGEYVEGNFLNIVARPALLKNYRDIFLNVKLSVPEFMVSPIVLGNHLLSEGEKRAGCVLIDLGSELTTVAVYHKNILRHLTVLPLGSKNITKDIMSLQIEEDEAESIKIESGSAYTPQGDIRLSDTGGEDKLLKDGRILKEKNILEIVEARVQEIVFNINEQLNRSGIDKGLLLSGIIVTGGGAGIKNLDKALTTYLGIEKITIKNKPEFGIVTAKNINADLTNGRYNTLLSIVYSGIDSCDGGDLNKTLFADETEDGEIVETGPQTSDEPHVGGTKVTSAKEAEILEMQEPQDEEEEARPKKPGMFKSMFKKAKDFLNNVTTED